ncbi:hypothetical protein H4R34_003180 [Dimargaris verticillata]|uniref:Uncharacterized protein n=1 Tax=Dimargaris verticillata TaxID=2761393 RepID=A0A9W8EDE0_9FUNG|nr:hypothetical protein H4R34_003180 [Dimargaris verticillata]
MPEVTITIRYKARHKHTVSVDPEQTTVQALKDQIAEPTETPVELQRLIFMGNVLKDEETLQNYSVQDGSTIQLFRRGAPAAQPATNQGSTAAATDRSASATSPGTGGGDTPTPTTTATSPPDAALPNPFAGSGASGLGGAGGGMPGMMNNPMFQEAMQGMMSNPSFQQSMQNMMSNPRMLELMAASNPQMASMMTPQMRQMFQNPEVMRTLMDPNFIRGMMTLQSAMGGGAGGQQQSPAGGLYNPWASPASPSGATTTNRTNSESQPAGAAPDGESTDSATNPTSPPAGLQNNPFLGLFNPGLAGGMGGGEANAPGAANPAAANELLQQLMGAYGMGAGAGSTGLSAGEANSNEPPEHRYQVQLQQLNEMGFYDASKNIRALLATNGNVDAAIEYLLSNL